MNHVSPCDGGCWFCYTDEGQMAFSTEFDTWLHLECLNEALEDDPKHPEALIIKREFGL